jgi:hypothetical protein
MSRWVKFTDRWPLRKRSGEPTLATLAALAGGHSETRKTELQRPLVYQPTHTTDITKIFTAKAVDAESGAATSPAAKVANPAKAEPLLLRDARRLWSFDADTIPSSVPDTARALADEARACGCTLVADGLTLILVERCLSNLPDDTRDAVAANAGAIIALLRGESRARTGEAQR